MAISTTVDLRYELLDRIGIQYDSWCDGELDEQELYDIVGKILDEITTKQKSREFNYLMEELLREEDDDE
jgi:hypothetical protein